MPDRDRYDEFTHARMISRQEWKHLTDAQILEYGNYLEA